MSDKFRGSPEITVERLLTLAYVGLFKYDIKSRQISWTPSFAKLLGLKRSEKGENVTQFFRRINSRDKDNIVRSFREIVKEGNDFTLVFRVNLPNKKIHWLHIAGLVARDPNGKAVSIEGLGINITKSKILEKELKRTINQLRIVFASVPVGITVEVKSGLIVYTNSEMLKLLEIDDPEEVIGKKIKNVLEPFELRDSHGNSIKASQLPASEVFKGKKKVTRIYSFENKDTGSVKWLKITATAVDPENAPAEMVVKVFQDITREQEQQKNTFASLGIASHELKNALASVKAYIQLVKRKLAIGDIETAKRFNETLDVQSMRLIKLINDLLDVSRIQSGILKLNPQEFNFSDLIEGLVTDYKQSHPDHKFSIKVQKDINLVADQDRIIQVIVNLLSNAYKYSDKESKITVTVKKAEDFVITKIKDEGIGISPADKNRVFELFRRGESQIVRNTSGLGIGLYTSNAIIKAHKGFIKLTSKPGKGSVFHIHLPVKHKN